MPPTLRLCAWRVSPLPAIEAQGEARNDAQGNAQGDAQADAQIAARAAVRLADGVRDAGSLALAMFRKPIKHWTKGPSSSPVCEADNAIDALLRERLTAGEARFAW